MFYTGIFCFTKANIGAQKGLHNSMRWVEAKMKRLIQRIEARVKWKVKIDSCFNRSLNSKSHLKEVLK